MKNLNGDKIVKIVSGVIMLIIIIFFAQQGNFNFLLGENNFNNIQGDQITKKEAGGERVDKNIFNHRLIDPSEYKSKLESGEYIHIDIRTPEEYQKERIANGLNIDFYAPDFKEQLNGLDKSKKYIYHCRSGSRSARAVPIFKELGFGEVLELDGGINKWKEFYPTISN